MQSSHTPTRRFTPVFDEDHLVSAGGLPAVMGLAQRAGLADLLNERLTVASPNAVVKTRALHRAARRKVPFPVVALVGYTNAGKSTLFNRMTGADVLARDMLR